MTFHSLDPHTLAFASTLTALVMAVAMVGIYLAGTRERAIVDWSLAGLFFATGHLIGHRMLAPEVDSPGALSLAMVNSFVALGYGFLLLGVQHYLQRRRWHVPVLLVTAGIFVLILSWPPMTENAPLRLGLITVIFVCLNLVTAGYLWRAKSDQLRSYHRTVAIILYLFAFLLSWRIVQMYLPGGLGRTGDANTLLVVTFLSAMLFYMSLSVSLSLMLMRRKDMHMHFLARHDALTGLLNRYSMERIAGRELARASRSRQPFSLVALDLDYFKSINDTFGHGAGDFVLKQVASRIGEIVRETDTAFRMGGEEFLIMLPYADAKAARAVADRLRTSLDGQPVRYRDQLISVSASFGVAMFEPGTDSWEDLLRRADRALYRAKDNGRNRVEIEPFAGAD